MEAHDGRSRCDPHRSVCRGLRDDGGDRCWIKPPSGDEPLLKPKLMITTVLQLADLTEAQRTQIATILQTHRVDVQAAREAGDPVEVRSAMRDAMREIVATLTPEQREAAKAAVRKAVAPQS